MNHFEVNQWAVDGSMRTPIRFIEQPVGKVQARLKNRILLTPEIDLGDYECRAVIDWSEIRTFFCRPSQGVAINSHLKKILGRSIYVCEEGNMTYRLRVQEPTDRFVDELLRAIDAKWGQHHEPEVMGLEISIDFRPKTYSAAALEKLFGILARTHLPSRDVLRRKSDRPRSGWYDGAKGHVSFIFPPGGSDAEQRLNAITMADGRSALIGATFYQGAKDSQVRWRTMVKEVDEQNIASGTRKDLPEAEHRVRIEVTLGVGELLKIGITTLAELKAFRFQTLQKRYFQFRLPTLHDTSMPTNRRGSRLAINAYRRQKFMKSGIVGLKQMDEIFQESCDKNRPKRRKRLGKPLQPKKRIGRGSSSSLVAYEALSKKVAIALDNLGRRMRTG